MQLYEILKETNTISGARGQGIDKFIQRGRFIWPDAMIADIYGVSLDYIQHRREELQSQPNPYNVNQSPRIDTEPGGSTSKEDPTAQSGPLTPEIRDNDNGWSVDNLLKNVSDDWKKFKNLFN